MKNLLQILLLVPFSSFSCVLHGQDSLNINIKQTEKFVKYVDFRVENGIMLNNGSELGEQVVDASYYNGVDFRVGFRKTDAYDVYSNVYRRPTMGLGYYFGTFNNGEVGSPSAFYYFFTIPFAFEKNKKLTFSYSGAFGLSYNFNPFDSISNPYNIFIGSYRNAYVHLGLTGNYKFNEKWAISSMLGLKHFSNGSIRKPNKGLNLIPFTVGLQYKISDSEIDHFKKPVPQFIRHNQFNVLMAFGSKNYVHDDPNYLKMTLGLNYLYAISYKYRIGMGMDIFYAAKAYLRTESGDAKFPDAVSIALVPSYEWVLTKRLFVPFGFGIYLHHNPENDEGTWYYERIGLRYRITDHINTGLTIKAHKSTADYFEWSLGYTFHKDQNKY